MASFSSDQELSSFASPRRGLAAFQATVSRLVLRTVAVGGVVAAVLVAVVHLLSDSGSTSNWLYLLAALGLVVMSWMESRRAIPRSLVPLIAMDVVIVARLTTADLFVAVAMLVPMFAVGLMAAFGLSDRELPVFAGVFFSLAVVSGVSYLVRFEAGSGVWRGMVAAAVGAGLAAVLVVLVRRENKRFVSQYESLYDSVSIGLVRIAADQVVAANWRLATMLGYDSAAEMEGLPTRSTVFDGDRFDDVRERLREGVPQEVRLRTKDGRPVWARVVLTPVLSPAGNGVGYEGFIEDLTESKRAEASADQAQARFATVFDSAPIGMALVDAAGAVIRANRAFTNLVGEAVFEVPGRRWTDILGGQLGSPRRFFDGNDGLVDDVQITDPDGARRWMKLRVSRPQESDRYSHYAIVQVLDVTPQVELESVLREQVRAKNDFIATVSHELRTPLTAVVGFIDELGSVVDDPSPDALEMIDIIAAEATSLSAIVEDLLVAARADIDRLTVVAERVNLRDVIDRVVRASSRLVIENGASIEVMCPEETTATADDRRVEQILWNLVTNAIRHGGDAITISAEPRGARIAVSVQDSGAGVPPDLRDEVFEPYSSFSADPGVTPSMGLGLYVAQKLAQLMGGGLSTRSDDGTSEFTLDLPAAAMVGESA